MWKFMVNMLYQKQRAEIGFDVSTVVISTSVTNTVENQRKKFEDAELQSLLDDDSTATL